jgi:virginiamycin B lyase
MWFTESQANQIGRVTTGGQFTEFPIRTPASGPGGITTGRDGALWFIESSALKIGRITTAGAVTDFHTPRTPVGGLAAGPDGALWFTELEGRVARITTDQPPEDAVEGFIFTAAPCDPPELGCTKPRYFFPSVERAVRPEPDR